MTYSAVYRNGVFVPTEKVELQEDTKVCIVPVLRSDAGKPAWERHRLHLGGLPGPDFDAPLPGMEGREE